ncbi:MAG: glycosyltransferase [Polyangiales bacterium]
MSGELSLAVVIATYNRGTLLVRLLEDLAAQRAAGVFEVVIVDDGSEPPARPLCEARRWPFPLRFIEQANTGQARARHRGISATAADIVVITDDDMALPPDFIAEHRALHAAGAEVVLGLIRPAEDLAQKPLFERFHAAQLAAFATAQRHTDAPPPGAALCTGNVSLRRARYLAVGGFDDTLLRSEDRDLGIRLEKAGAKLVFSERAYCLHHSDHTDRVVWLQRAFNYGISDYHIGRKHADDKRHDPWIFWLLVNPVSRPLLLAAVGSDALGRALSQAAQRTSEWLDDRGLERLAIKGTTLVYGLEYFRGVRAAYASTPAALRGWVRFLRKRS